MIDFNELYKYREGNRLEAKNTVGGYLKVYGRLSLYQR